MSNPLRKVVSALLGESCLALSPLSGGGGSKHTFLVSTVERQVVAKVYDDPRSVTRAVRNIQSLARLGVPVPRVLAWVDSPEAETPAVLVMTHLPGHDLHRELPSMSRHELSKLAAEVQGIQGTVATLPVLGQCGYAGVGEHATRTWGDVVRRPNGFPYADPLPPDTARLFERLHLALDDADAYFSTIRPVCFLDDITTRNVMVDNGRLAGVVDLDWVAFGDPLLCLGLTAAAVTVAAPPTGRHYVDELIRFADVGAEQRRMLEFYEAVYLVNFLGAEWPHRGGRWRAIAAAAASKRLSGLGFP